MKDSDILRLVKEGYNTVAHKYHELTDKSKLKLPPYIVFKSLVVNEYVIELGCGSGHPVAEDLILTGYRYLGIDVSETQIEIARELYPDHSTKFQVGEMLETVRAQPVNSVGGIIMFFSMFHLPRKYHVELLEEIFRVLQPKAPVIFTSATSSWVGTEENWLSANGEMYWSNFSHSWYDRTLLELGFEPVLKYRYEAIFDGENEISYYHVAKKPDSAIS